MTAQADEPMKVSSSTPQRALLQASVWGCQTHRLDVGREGNFWPKRKGCSCCFAQLERARNTDSTATEQPLVRTAFRRLVGQVCFSLFICPAESKGWVRELSFCYTK